MIRQVCNKGSHEFSAGVLHYTGYPCELVYLALKLEEAILCLMNKRPRSLHCIWGIWLRDLRNFAAPESLSESQANGLVPHLTLPHENDLEASDLVSLRVA